jgi:hypothetical protein
LALAYYSSCRGQTPTHCLELRRALARSTCSFGRQEGGLGCVIGSKNRYRNFDSLLTQTFAKFGIDDQVPTERFDWLPPTTVARACTSGCSIAPPFAPVRIGRPSSRRGRRTPTRTSHSVLRHWRPESCGARVGRVLSLSLYRMSHTVATVSLTISSCNWNSFAAAGSYLICS